MIEQFSRTISLIGEDNFNKLQDKKIIIFGVGGVGGYAIEALARCGIKTIALVDCDVVSQSNLNRQIIALNSTIGKYKVDVVAERLLDINPHIKINKRKEFVLPETIGDFDFTLYDYVIDAIDTVSGKLAIIEAATNAGTTVLSCMGTGNKLDPTALCVTDISKTNTCPLARVMRRELKVRGIAHLKVVYSTEEPKKLAPAESSHGRHAPASIAFVPSVAGLIAASEAVKHIIASNNEKEGEN